MWECDLLTGRDKEVMNKFWEEIRNADSRGQHFFFFCKGADIK